MPVANPGALAAGPAARLAAAGIAVAAAACVALASGPQPGTRYEIEPGSSSVGFDLGATGHTVHGRAGKLGGRVEVLGADAGGFPLAGELRLEAASLDTGNGRRDRKMREQSLAVARFPEIVFAARRLSPREGGASGQDASAFVLEGDLSIRDVTRSVSIRVELRPEDGMLRVAGEVQLRWADFGVPDPSFLFLRVKPTLRVRFETTWRPAAAP
jgi:polyisoprenoid-binding protein YceI